MRQKASEISEADRLRRRAEAQLQERGATDLNAAEDPRRLVHELQVHQVELEMQNAELQEARDRMEGLLAKYTDLYDFAPVGYFAVDEGGRILEANLTGAALLGVERSRCVRGVLSRFIHPASRPVVETFMSRILAGDAEEVCEAKLRKRSGGSFWANLHGAPSPATNGTGKWVRLAVTDIESSKQAEEAERRLKAVTAANRELKAEIVRRRALQTALKNSERRQAELLERAQGLQGQLRRWSHRNLEAQEDERKRISRELHDRIAQTLVSVNVHLESLARGATVKLSSLKHRISRTQRLVERSIDTVHEFARELRPPILDDLGLTPTLRSLARETSRRGGFRVAVDALLDEQHLNGDQRTLMYRITQSALINAEQHAQAKRVTIRVRGDPDAVCLQIADDGVGFDAVRAMGPRPNLRLGLLGMRERVEMAGGTFTIESAPGKGTTVLVRIPMGPGVGGRSSGPRAKRRTAGLAPASAENDARLTPSPRASPGPDETKAAPPRRRATPAV